MDGRAMRVMVMVMVLLPPAAVADSSNRSGERISLAPSYANISRTTESQNSQTSDPAMETGQLDGHGVGAHLEVAPVWQLGRVWLGPLFRVGLHRMSTDERSQFRPPVSDHQTLAYVHIAPQLTLTFDRFYVRADAGVAHIFGRTLQSKPPAIEAGVELGISHPIGPHTTGQLGLGLWMTWARPDGEGDTFVSETRGRLIEGGLNWSVMFTR